MTTLSSRRFAVALVFSAAFCFASDALAQSCPLPGQTSMLVVRMFFGQTIEGRRTIAPAAWQAFLRDEVTSRFPDGLTVFDAYGQWRDPATRRIGRERSKVVEIATPDTPAIRAKIEDVAARYRALFHQQSVGIVTMPGCAAF
jgi:Protein of unknown function (DUF3574)